VTTYQWIEQPSVASEAEFRAWGQSISDALDAIGLIQTADTGQIDWTTVGIPTISTVSGYEIWRFNDAAQTNAPVFIKIEYGAGSTLARPLIWITVGTGSNGSGTITTIWGSRTQMNSTGNAAAGDQIHYACFDAATGTFWMSLNALVASPNFFVMVARYGDDNGLATEHGALAWIKGTSTPASNTMFGYSADLALAIVPVPGWSVGRSFAAGAVTVFGQPGIVSFPISITGDRLHWMGGAVGIASADWPFAGVWTLTHLGTSRTFISMGGWGHTVGTDAAASTGTSLLLVWE
jgi:hypothetical protein